MLVGRGGYILANIGENLASGLPKIGKIASSFLAKALYWMRSSPCHFGGLVITLRYIRAASILLTYFAQQFQV